MEHFKFTKFIFSESIEDLKNTQLTSVIIRRTLMQNLTHVMLQSFGIE